MLSSVVIARNLTSLATITLVLCLNLQAAWCETRVALVVGNSAYERVAPLPNAVRDAALVAQALTSTGFDVILKQDLTKADFETAIDGFIRQMRGADVALIYFAGHGVQSGGENYLLPTDVDFTAGTSVRRLVRLNELLDEMQIVKRTRVVFLDACRDNQLARSANRPVDLSALPAGLAPLPPDSKGAVRKGPGLAAIFAAEPGVVAFDGPVDGNSPFATALTGALQRPGLELHALFNEIRDSVMRATADRQSPTLDLRTGEFYFREGPPEAGPTLATVLPATLPKGARRQIERRLEKIVEQYGEATRNDSLWQLEGLIKSGRVGPHDLANALEDSMARLRSLRQATALENSNYGGLAPYWPLLDRAASMISEGRRPDLDGAQRLLDEVLARHGRHRDQIDAARRLLDEENDAVTADLLVRSAAVARLRFDLRRAIDLYQRAVALTRPSESRLLWQRRLKLTEAQALELGRLPGTSALESLAGELEHDIIPLIDRDREPNDWAAAQVQRSQVLNMLGWRLGPEHGRAHIEQAMHVAQQTLAYLPERQQSPERGKALVALGAALLNRGGLIDPSMAIDVLRQATRALEEAGRHSDQLSGEDLLMLEVVGLFSAISAPGTTRERKHAEARRILLGIEARVEAIPETQVKSGAAGLLAFSRMLVAYLAEPMDRALLSRVRTDLERMIATLDRNDAPMQWAEAQALYGSVLGVGIGRSGNIDEVVALAERRIAAFEAALSVITFDASPAQWAMTTENLAIAKRELGAPALVASTGIEQPEQIYQAIKLLDQVLAVRPREASPALWAQTHKNISEMWRILAAHEPEFAAEHLAKAVSAAEAVADVWNKDASRVEHASAQWQLARTLLTLLPHLPEEQHEHQARRAITAYEGVIASIDKSDEPNLWLTSHQGIAGALMTIAEKHPVDVGKALLAEAMISVRKAREIDADRIEPAVWWESTRYLAALLMTTAEYEVDAKAKELHVSEAITLLEETVSRSKSAETWIHAIQRMHLSDGLSKAADLGDNTNAAARRIRALEEINATLDLDILGSSDRVFGKGTLLQAHGRRVALAYFLSAEEPDAKRRAELMAFVQESTRQQLKFIDKSANPTEWAWARFDIGLSSPQLLKSGQISAQLTAIDNQIEAARAALEAVSPKLHADQWAFFQCSIGIFLKARADRLSGRERLHHLLRAAAELRQGLGVGEQLGPAACRGSFDIVLTSLRRHLLGLPRHEPSSSAPR